MVEISNMDDILYSRYIIGRIEELSAELGDDGGNAILVDLQEELDALKALVEQLGSPEDSVTLIRDSYLEEYARELARDIGAIGSDYQWPLDYIDWEAAADELRMDYQKVDFDGVTYWVR